MWLILPTEHCRVTVKLYPEDYLNGYVFHTSFVVFSWLIRQLEFTWVIFRSSPQEVYVDYTRATLPLLQANSVLLQCSTVATAISPVKHSGYCMCSALQCQQIVHFACTADLRAFCDYYSKYRRCLKNIDPLVFITKKSCFLCEVGIDYYMPGK